MAENGTPFEFPCDVPVKVFGFNDERFRAVVREIVGRYFPDFTDDDLRERPSRRDRYLSLTVIVRVETREQIDALYTELSAHEAVLMLL